MSIITEYPLKYGTNVIPLPTGTKPVGAGIMDCNGETEISVVLLIEAPELMELERTFIVIITNEEFNGGRYNFIGSVEYFGYTYHVLEQIY